MINKLVQSLSRTKLWEKSIKYIGSTRIFPNRQLVLTRNNFEAFYECEKIIKKGDILVSRIYDLMNNVFIPGKFDHVAIYAGNGWILETRGEPVNFKILKKMFYSDNVILLSSNLDDEYRDKMIAEGEKYLTLPYDYQFRMDIKTGVYCSELVYYCDYEKRLKIPTRSRFGIECVVPDDFLLTQELFIKKEWS